LGTRVIPPKRICEDFSIVYELRGAQRAVDLLAKHYKVQRMKIILDGRRVGGRYLAVYFDNRAFFKKRGLTKRIVLHEFYHHLVSSDKIIAVREEWEANNYARMIISKCKK
jgi:hypothetical protein